MRAFCKFNEKTFCKFNEKVLDKMFLELYDETFLEQISLYMYNTYIKNDISSALAILSCPNLKVRKILIISQAIHCEFRCCICYT